MVPDPIPGLQESGSSEISYQWEDAATKQNTSEQGEIRHNLSTTKKVELGIEAN